MADTVKTEETEKTAEETYQVGGQIVSWCTKCKLMLDHAIVALVDEFPKKVKCNTCRGHHNYRDKEPAPKGASRRKQSGYQISMQELGESYDFSTVKKYSMKGNFKADQVIEHATLGIGFVVSIIEHKKIEALFETGSKKLVQNR